MAEAVPMSTTGAEALMENAKAADMLSSPCSSFRPSPCPKVKSSGSKRTREDAKKASIGSRRRSLKNKIGSVAGSEIAKPDFSRRMSPAVKPHTSSSIGPMEFESPENASGSKASEGMCGFCTEDSPATTMDSTALAKSSSRSGCAGKDPSKRVKPRAKAIEVCTPSKKPSKRKRSLFQETLDSELKTAHIQQFQQEIASLIKYFNEEIENKSFADTFEATDVRNNTTNVIIARSLEESRLPFSKLVQHIYEKLKKQSDKNGGETTLAFVRSSVLFIGQRSSYGISNADADVLEDESESCLWCWEVRDLKLLAKSQRDFISIRRRCRKKIHDRITALSAMISALLSSESEECSKIDLAKAEEMLAKADDEMSIRAMVADLLQKNNAQIMARQAKLKEKEAIKEKERNDRKVDMEQKRLDRELKREKVHQEKERERLEREASKERARAQKEALNQEKELKRQQDEAEKEQKRKEKEEAEMKKQLAIQKQATIMDRFLHGKRDPSNTSQIGSTAVKGTTPNPLKENEQMCAVMMLMDRILSQGLDERQSDSLLRSHLAAWHDIYRQISSQRPVSWGMRRKPKVALFKELRLQGASTEVEASGKLSSITSKRRASNDIEDVHEFKAEKLINEWEEQALNDSLPGNNVMVNAHRDSRFYNKRRKLLQFDKSHRPAYYGTFSKKSDAVGPRHPFRKDSSLDYENDSDEEWEEEDPGESLSDCDKDDEEEKIEAEKEKVKAEEDDDSEDGFLVPDGYLSENEGVCLDDVESDVDEDSSEDLPTGNVSQCCCKGQQLETEHELRTFERQQRLLENATEHALRSNCALVVSNLFKDRTTLMNESVTPELSATHKLEQVCLQALRIRVFSPDIRIELCSESPTEPSLQEDREPCKRQRKSCTMLPDSDLPELVCVIQSSTQGMNKIVETLLKRFPHVAKRQLKNKIREISDFVDNQWKVKREVLEKLGMSCLPVQSSESTKTPALQLKGIATFFSKRCLPPEVSGISGKSSPNKNSLETQKNVLPDMTPEEHNAGVL